MKKFFLIIFFCYAFFSSSKLNAQVKIKMIKQGGVYEIPCTVNGLKLYFIFDTGSSFVSISLTEAVLMHKYGYLNSSDLVGSSYSQLADGNIIKNTTITLRELDIGGIKLYNVKAIIVHNLHAPLLLGQSAINKLGKIQLNGDELLILSKNLNKSQFYATTVQDNFFQTNLQAAEQGYSQAQYTIALMYRKGEGISKNFNQAFYWFKKSAEQDYAKAQFYLGVMYELGIGVSKDLHQAFYWYKKSAEQGVEEAQFNIALMYDKGDGTQKDENKALYWYEKSAAQGDAIAQYNLAYMYYHVQGTLKDLKKAFYWYEKSAAQGYSKAQYMLALMYDNGEGVSTNKVRAFSWYKKSAEQGLSVAQCELGLKFENGDGVFRNEQKAFYWFKKSAEQGLPDGEYYLGIMYYFGGSGIPKNKKQAAYWVKKAYDNGFKKAKDAWNGLELGKYEVKN